MVVSQNALQRRLSGMQDARGDMGILSRGANVYNGGTPEATMSAQPVNSPQYTFKFDPTYAEGRRDIGQQNSMGRQNFLKGMSDLNVDAQKRRGTLASVFEDAIEAQRQRAAGQGTLRSGINLEEQGRIGQQALRASDELETGAARGQRDLREQLLQTLLGGERLRQLLENNRARGEADVRFDEDMGFARGRALEPDASGRFLTGLQGGDPRTADPLFSEDAIQRRIYGPQQGTDPSISSLIRRRAQ